MTIIATYITRYGIVSASDSALVIAGQSGIAKKIFRVECLKADLAVAGAYGVGSVMMHTWMDQFINADHSATLSEFAERLRTALETGMTTRQKENSCIVQCAGYVLGDSGWEPRVWHIRNVGDIDDNTGEYGPTTEGFRIDEVFWEGGAGEHRLQNVRAYDWGYQGYVNGFPEGRISYNILTKQLNKFMTDAWNKPNAKFRPPRNLAEARIFVEINLRIIAALFALSDYSGPPIGEPIETRVIDWPNPSSPGSGIAAH